MSLNKLHLNYQLGLISCVRMGRDTIHDMLWFNFFFGLVLVFMFPFLSFITNPTLRQRRI